MSIFCIYIFIFAFNIQQMYYLLICIIVVIITIIYISKPDKKKFIEGNPIHSIDDVANMHFLTNYTTDHLEYHT